MQAIERSFSLLYNMTMAGSDQDLMISVAVDYYEKDFSQKEIAEKYKISRVTVSSYLKRSRQEGIVDIRVNKKPSLAFSLQTELQSCLAMERVVVCTSDADETRTRIIVGRAASDLLKSRLHDELVIGISYGTTLYETVHQLIVRKHFKGIQVVQLLGAMGSRDAMQDGFELARTLSAKVDGTYRIIQAPLVVQNEQLKEMLLEISRRLHRSWSSRGPPMWRFSESARTGPISAASFAPVFFQATSRRACIKRGPWEMSAADISTSTAGSSPFP